MREDAHGVVNGRAVVHENGHATLARQAEDLVPLRTDDRDRDLLVGEGAPVELTAFEYRLLEYLMLRAGQVVSKAELTEKLYEQDFERDSNTIEVFIGRLRRKLDPDGKHQPIETLRGRGYRIARG